MANGRLKKSKGKANSYDENFVRRSENQFFSNTVSADPRIATSGNRMFLPELDSYSAAELYQTVLYSFRLYRAYYVVRDLIKMSERSSSRVAIDHIDPSHNHIA